MKRLLDRALPLEKDQAFVTLREVTELEDLPPHQLAPKVHWGRASGYFALEMFDEAEREQGFAQEGSVGQKRKDAAFWPSGKNRKTGVSAQEIARGLRQEFPDEADWWVSDAYATRRCDSIESAREILLKGLTVHEDSSLIRYNLACYACVLDNLPECMEFLKEAVVKDEKYKRAWRSKTMI